MPHILREVRELRQEGKLHQGLIRRTRIFLFVSAALLCASTYFSAAQHAEPLLAVILALVGFAAGYFVFSRITPVQWNEANEQVEGAAMGRLGYAMIGLYIVFEVGARTLLGDVLGDGYQAYLFALIFGVIFGRTIGVVAEIHRVYLATHAQ